MKKKNFKEKDFKLFCPESSADIDDIVGILLEGETSILVNLSKYQLKQDVVTKIINYIVSFQTVRMVINVKKVNSKAFICWSEHPVKTF